MARVHFFFSFLRLTTLPACRGEKRVRLSAVAAMCGLSRLALYNVLWTSDVLWTSG
jgi:hypothetical protein